MELICAYVANRNAESSDILRILDDHNFHQVFKYLNLQDICAVSKCCRRLNRVADDGFIYKFRATPIRLTHPECPIFKKYSAEVRDLRLELPVGLCSAESISSVLMPTVNLQKLSIINCWPLMFCNLGNALSRLSELHLQSDLALHLPLEIINSRLCHHLRKLTIEGDISIQTFKVHFTALRELSISGRCFVNIKKVFTEFVSKHTGLIKLKLDFKPLTLLTKANLQCLSLLHNLTHLDIRINATEIILPKFNEMSALQSVFFRNNYVYSYINFRWEKSIYCDTSCIQNHFKNLELKDIVMPQQIISTTHYPSDGLIHIINIAKHMPILWDIKMDFMDEFFNGNNNIIIVLPNLMKLLTSKKDSQELLNLHPLNFNMFYRNPPPYYFTYIDEVSDLKEITFIELSSSTRNLLLRDYVLENLNDIQHIRQAVFCPCYCKNHKQLNQNENSSDFVEEKQRIFFSSYARDISIVRLKF